MYDLIQNLWLGMTVAVTPMNVFLCLIGALVGTLIGVLPGVGPVATIAMLIMVALLCGEAMAGILSQAGRAAAEITSCE